MRVRSKSRHSRRHDPSLRMHQNPKLSISPSATIAQSLMLGANVMNGLKPTNANAKMTPKSAHNENVTNGLRLIVDNVNVMTRLVELKRSVFDKRKPIGSTRKHGRPKHNDSLRDPQL